MIKKVTYTGGYSKRIRQTIASSSRSQEPISSPRRQSNKLKLPEIKIDAKSSLTNTRNYLYKNNPIIRPIFDKAKDYENAIKDHLGIKNISRDSSLSSLSPKIQRKNWDSPRRGFHSIDHTTLANFEKQESKIEENIRSKRTERKNISKKPGSYKADEGAEKDREIKEVQESLNKINILLRKLLNKK